MTTDTLHTVGIQISNTKINPLYAFLGLSGTASRRAFQQDNESFKTHMIVNLYYINQKQVHRKLK